MCREYNWDAVEPRHQPTQVCAVQSARGEAPDMAVGRAFVFRGPKGTVAVPVRGGHPCSPHQGKWVLKASTPLDHELYAPLSTAL